MHRRALRSTKGSLCIFDYRKPAATTSNIQAVREAPWRTPFLAFKFCTTHHERLDQRSVKGSIVATARLLECLVIVRRAEELSVDGGHVLNTQRASAHAAAEARLVEGLVVRADEFHRVDRLCADGALGLRGCGGCEGNKAKERVSLQRGVAKTGSKGMLNR
jgi:hypothetical protein